ncbi:uncharacterized protein LOC122247744 [Penaeus japonicus]|uniref:uncharacterized protein LOC122247744 n=1 Tax=Penaeus japonicus TaxID=27405 RepID=UPI001C712FF7|nr:uncharacterized protein LOC122247744 [Penaeus japonicus]
MKSLIVLLAAIVTVAKAQYAHGSSAGAASFSSASAGSFGSSVGVGGFASGFGRPFGVGSYGSSGFGSGGPIIFPSDSRPSVNLPVRPGVQPGRRPFPARPGQPVLQPAGPFPVRPAPALTSQYPICSPGLVDHEAFGSRYHFSWCHDGFQNYTQPSAINYCTSLGPGWNGVSIETAQEDNLLASIIGGHNLAWIWTAGIRNNQGQFYWPSGAVFSYSNWSPTGFDNRPQPDNRENNNEQCLAILNNFYNDGIKWHDIGCHHLKPIVCEQYV